MRLTWICALFFTLFTVIRGDSDGCNGVPNTNPVVTEEPQYLRKAFHGKLYDVTGGGLIDPPLLIAHLYGTPREMGIAYGQLLAYEIRLLMNETYLYFYEQIGQYIKFLEPELQQKIEEEGVDIILEYVWVLARPHIPERYIEEMKGVAEGSGLPYKEIYQMAMIPEALKASCTMVGAWDKATPNGCSLVQLRALDWDTNGPFQQFPVVLVYHPTDGGHPFSVLSWTGLVGAITGFSDAQVAICEKVWYGYDGKDSRRGTPFTFVLRDILQFDKTKEDAIDRMNTTDRTCAIFVGVGDNTSNEMDVVQYSYESLTAYNSTTYPTCDGHPYIEDVIYVDKYVQPSSNPCLGNVLNEGWGGIDAFYLFQQAAARLQTGDMHVAVYDYLNQFMYVSNAQVYVPGQPQLMAYQRPYVRLNMSALFNEPL